MKFIKIMSALLAAALLMTGCGSEKKPEGQEFPDKASGTVFYITQEYLDKGISVDATDVDYENHIIRAVCWYYTPVTDKLFDEIYSLSQDELTPEVIEAFYDQLDIHSKYLVFVTLVEEDEYNKRKAAGESDGDMTYWGEADYLGKNGDYVYLVTMPEADTEGMSEEEEKLFEECRAYAKTIKENIKLIDIETRGDLPETIPSFSAKDLDGNIVTESIIGEKDLTVINIWGTFCGPCINEMPELGDWARELPDNVQLIGLVCDINGDEDKEHHDLAVEITQSANADYLNLIANNDFSSIVDWVTGVPTTIFVNKDGKLVGEPIVGAKVQAYKDFVEAYING